MFSIAPSRTMQLRTAKVRQLLRLQSVGFRTNDRYSSSSSTPKKTQAFNDDEVPFRSHNNNNYKNNNNNNRYNDRSYGENRDRYQNSSSNYRDNRSGNRYENRPPRDNRDNRDNRPPRDNRDSYNNDRNNFERRDRGNFERNDRGNFERRDREHRPYKPYQERPTQQDSYPNEYDLNYSSKPSTYNLVSAGSLRDDRRPKKDISTITSKHHLKRIEERKKNKIAPIYRSIIDDGSEPILNEEGEVDLTNITASSEKPGLPKGVKKNFEKIPDHLRVCRGCGAGFQCDDTTISGYVPPHHLAAYVDRTTLQIQAAKHDLRIRSGGGKGKGTAVAALHASMQAALIQEEADMEERINHGAYSASKLAEMGLDHNMKPLPTAPDYDEDGNLVTYNENAHVRAYDPEGAKMAKREYEKKKIEEQENPSVDVEVDEDGKVVADKKFSPEVTRPIHKDEIIEYRDLKTIEKAAKKAAKPLRCMRCHQMSTSAVPRSTVASVHADDFVQLLRNEFLRSGGQSCVIIKMVDLFDFHGSFIRDFKSMAGGRNPIILCINKVDLLPENVGRNRVAAWIKREAAKYNIHYHSLAMISATTGEGIEELTKKAYSLARGANNPSAPSNRNIYIVGTTNVGKSTLVNTLLKKNFIGTGLPTDIAGMNYRRAIQSGYTDGIVDAPELDNDDNNNTDEATKKVKKTDDPATDVSLRLHVTKIPQTTLEKVIPSDYLVDYHQELLRNSAYTTTSPLPGTTLGVVSFPILESKRGAKNVQLRDTPGVINPHQLTSYLHYDELRCVLPSTVLKPLTYRVKPGQSILIGGFARIDILAGRPFFLSTFTSRRITVHITATKNITEDYLRKNLGITIFPPFDAEDRADALHIYEALALDDAEIQQMEDLQDNSISEFKSSMARVSQIAGKRAGDKFAKDDYNDAITLSLDTPKSSRDRTNILRLEGKNTVNSVLDANKLIPIETSIDTESPARSFIDGKGRVIYQIQGNGWEQASHDIVLAGLGWVSTTGVGPLTIRVALAGKKIDIPDSNIAQDVTNSKSAQEFRNQQVKTALTRAGVQEYDPALVNVDLSQEDELANGLHPELHAIYARTQIRNPLLPYDVRGVLKFTGASEAVKLFGPGAGFIDPSRRQEEMNNKKFKQKQKEPTLFDDNDRDHASDFEFDEDLLEHEVEVEAEVEAAETEAEVETKINTQLQQKNKQETKLDKQDRYLREFSKKQASSTNFFEDDDDDIFSPKEKSRLEQLDRQERHRKIEDEFDDLTRQVEIPAPVKKVAKNGKKLDTHGTESDKQRLQRETEQAWLDVLKIREARKLTPEQEEEARQRTLAQMEEEAENVDQDTITSEFEEFEDPFSDDSDFNVSGLSDIDLDGSEFDDLDGLNFMQDSDMSDMSDDADMPDFLSSDADSKPNYQQMLSEYTINNAVESDGVSDYEGPAFSEEDDFLPPTLPAGKLGPRGGLRGNGIVKKSVNRELSRQGFAVEDEDEIGQARNNNKSKNPYENSNASRRSTERIDRSNFGARPKPVRAAPRSNHQSGGGFRDNERQFSGRGEGYGNNNRYNDRNSGRNDRNSDRNDRNSDRNDRNNERSPRKFGNDNFGSGSRSRY